MNTFRLAFASFTLGFLLYAPGEARADRLFSIPTGKKIPRHVVRLEWAGSPDGRFTRERLGLGLTETFDMEIDSTDLWQSGRQTTFDISYNLNDPITDLGPGVSGGVQDVLDQTREGRRFFVAITFAEGNTGTYNQDTPTYGTLGAYLSKDGVRGFAGASLPFTNEVLLFAEYDSFRPTAGFELRPFRGAVVRWMAQPRTSLFSVSFGRRF